MVLLRDFSRERQFCAHRSAAVLCVAGGGDSCVTCRFRSGYRRLFRQVVERKFDYAVHVVVVKAVVNFFAYAFVAYQFCLAQYAQLMADGGLGHVENGTNVAHAQFRFGKRGQNAYTRAVTENFE